MAFYRLSMQRLSRSAGRTATGAAAYRAGVRIRDERTGRAHDHAYRRDVVHAEILLPTRLAGAVPDWTRERAALWNEAERTERRRDSIVAREYQVSLPAELDAQQRLRLARQFSQQLADRHGTVVDLAVHAPPPGGDPRNHHAHLLVATRELGPAGFGRKTGIDLAYAEAQQRGLPRGVHELIAIRERWADLTNSALRDANFAVRVDHRTLAAQGIHRNPQPQFPWAAIRAHGPGMPSKLTERVRAAYRARLAQLRARAVSAEQPAHDDATHIAPQRPEGAAAEAPIAARAEPAAVAGGASGELERLRQDSREAWLRLRARERGRETTQRSEALEREGHDLLDSDGPS